MSKWTPSRARRLWLSLPEGERVRLGSLIANPPVELEPAKLIAEDRCPIQALTESENKALLASLTLG